MNLKKAIKKATSILSNRKKSIYKAPHSQEERANLNDQFEIGARREGRSYFEYEFLSNGELAYFIFAHIKFMGEYSETFLLFPHLYCVSHSGYRRKFYNQIKKIVKEHRGVKEVKRYAVWASHDDLLTRNYFDNS